MSDVTVQAVLRAGFNDYSKSHPLPGYVVNAAERMIACRTSAMGGHKKVCPQGHVELIWYNSCKDRSCPQCAFLDMEKWLARQKSRLLSCHHYHTIFTVPSELNSVWAYNRKIFADCMFHSVRDTFYKLLGDPKYLGATPGMVMSAAHLGKEPSLIILTSIVC